MWENPMVSPIINYINGWSDHSQYMLDWFEDAGPYDFRVAPGGFDLESSTAFFEPGMPLIALVVFKLEIFVAPDERGTSLRARIGSGSKTRARAIKTKQKTYGSGQVSQLPVPVPPGVDEEYESYWYSGRDVEGSDIMGGKSK